MAVLLDAPLHLRATVGGFCSGRTLQALLYASRTAAERFSEPAVLQQVAFWCHYCDAQFTAADNAPDACHYHPCDVTSWHDSQGNESIRRRCCNVSYCGSHYAWDASKADGVIEAPPCLSAAHYPGGARQEVPLAGARVEVLAGGRWVGGVVQSWGPVTPVYFWQHTDDPLPTWDVDDVLLAEHTERIGAPATIEATVQLAGGRSEAFRPWQVRWPSVAPRWGL